jgi:hypothetical protein
MSANYELYGVVVHYGAHSRVGHYVSFVKVANAWYTSRNIAISPSLFPLIPPGPYLQYELLLVSVFNVCFTVLIAAVSNIVVVLHSFQDCLR